MCHKREGQWMATEWEVVEEGGRRRLWHTKGWSSGSWHLEEERSNTPRIRSGFEWGSAALGGSHSSPSTRVSCERRCTNYPRTLSTALQRRKRGRERVGRGRQMDRKGGKKWQQSGPICAISDSPLLCCHGCCAQKKKLEVRKRGKSQLARTSS